MKVIVKQNCTAYYKMKLRNPGEILNINEDKCPVWAKVIEELTETSNDKKDASDAEEKEIKQQELIVPTSDGTNAEETSNDKKDAEKDKKLYEELSALLDEAVNLGIAYELDDKLSVEEQIEMLKKAIENKRTAE